MIRFIHPTVGMLTTLALVVVAAQPARSWAGPINPPTGPVAPTPGPEPRIPISDTTTPGDADSLFRITQPGSYYLTGNTLGVSGKSGIEIDSSGVTLDLNGFEMRGVTGSLDGVVAVGTSLRNISVFNGNVVSWGGDGVDLKTLPANACRADRLTVTANGGTGISLGPTGMITRCTSSLNAGDGMIVGSGSTITGCLASQNTGTGINTAVPGTFEQGFSITDCTVKSNGFDGITCNSRSLVRGNTCVGNGVRLIGAGIRIVGLDVRVEGNTATGNRLGIVVSASGNFITRNTCSGNSANNWEVVSGNVVLAVAATTNTIAVRTSGGGGTAPGSTDPNANFTH